VVGIGVEISVEDTVKREYLLEANKLLEKQIQKNIDKIIEYEKNEHVQTVHGPGRLDGVVTGHDDRLIMLEGVVESLLNRIDVLENK